MFTVTVYRYVQSNHIFQKLQNCFYRQYQISKTKKQTKNPIVIQTFTLKKIKLSGEFKNHIKSPKISRKPSHEDCFQQNLCTSHFSLSGGVTSLNTLAAGHTGATYPRNYPPLGTVQTAWFPFPGIRSYPILYLFALIPFHLLISLLFFFCCCIYFL